MTFREQIGFTLFNLRMTSPIIVIKMLHFVCLDLYKVTKRKKSLLRLSLGWITNNKYHNYIDVCQDGAGLGRVILELAQPDGHPGDVVGVTSHLDVARLMFKNNILPKVRSSGYQNLTHDWKVVGLNLIPYYHATINSCTQSWFIQ